MKRIICITVLFAFLFSLAGCTKSQPSAHTSAKEIKGALGLSGRVYASLLQESEEGYISEDMREAFFDEYSLPLEYALIVTSRIDVVSEIGIFYADGEVGVPDLIELASHRLRILGELSHGGESLTVRYGDAVVYAYVTDVEETRRALDGVFA